MRAQEITHQIAEYFKTQPVQKAWLFGSFARGEEHEDSDVDLLVRFDDDAHVGLFAHTRMVMDLENLLGRDVDLVPEKAMYEFMAEDVEHDKQLIYSKA